MSISRRKFIRTVTVASGGVLAGIGLTKILLPHHNQQNSSDISLLNAETTQHKTEPGEVMFYEKLDDAKVRCQICPKSCIVSVGKRGYCGNKENQEGHFYNKAYGKACAVHIDPIEKKPFFHFLPGTKAFSVSTAGCNFECHYCQNWQISQSKPEDVKNDDLPPQKIIDICQEKKIPVIAFTYAEPIVFYEYMFDTAKLAREKGINSVMVSNGHINEKPLRQLCEQLSAVKIDLKSFSDEFYQKCCNGRLQPVLDTLLTLKKVGIWFEIVALIIPTLNDNAEEIKKMCNWIKDNLGVDVPLHFSRFTPMYKLTNLPKTPPSTLEKAYEIAKQSGLKFVYVGNITPHVSESTCCPNCKKVLIKRTAYDIIINEFEKGQCLSCKTKIPGVWGKE